MDGVGSARIRTHQRNSSSGSATMPRPSPPAPVTTGLDRPSASEPLLQPHDVDPPVLLPADLAHHADLLERERLVQRDARRVGQGDAASARCTPSATSRSRSSPYIRRPRALPGCAVREVDRRLAGVAIARLGPVRRRVGVATDLAVDSAASRWSPGSVLASRASHTAIGRGSRSNVATPGLHLVPVDRGDRRAGRAPWPAGSACGESASVRSAGRAVSGCPPCRSSQTPRTGPGS